MPSVRQIGVSTKSPQFQHLCCTGTAKGADDGIPLRADRCNPTAALDLWRQMRCETSASAVNAHCTLKPAARVRATCARATFFMSDAPHGALLRSESRGLCEAGVGHTSASVGKSAARMIELETAA